jgi:hypothetical protein
VRRQHGAWLRNAYADRRRTRCGEC